MRFRLRSAVFMVFLIAGFAFSRWASAEGTEQRAFKSPQEAFKALVEAAKENDTTELLAIFGPDGRDIISSGDAVADERARERFVRAAGEAAKFSKANDETEVVAIGKDAWSFPVPIVRSGDQWIFSTKDGRREIINRRIGRNELNTIQVCLTYVKAQTEYAAGARNGGGVPQFAQRFLSSPGKKDGLYWEVSSGEETSPLGPLIARASEEGYAVRKSDKRRVPYHGYYFRILKGQGDNAPGGEIDYVKDGKMTAGFALLAYPALYGVSGIMTFVVNGAGIVYEKNLGPETSELSKKITRYDPDSTWKRAERVQSGPSR